MKKIIKYTLSIFLIGATFQSCDTRKEVAVKAKDFELKFGVPELSNPKINSVIQEYIEGNQDGIPKVYTMVVQRKDILTTSISICALTTYDELYKLLPSGYFKVNDNVVLVYTGLEHLEMPDSTFMKELEKTVGNRIEDNLLEDRKTIDPDYEARIYDPHAWEIKLVKDSVIVNRDSAINVLGPPIVEVIKFVPPKKN
ncbi:MAG: hypothetical protein ACOYXT_23970 [Bacteroidota bacterium]